MWEDILKATFTLPKGTSVGKIKILMGHAIKLPKLETEFLEEKKLVEEKNKAWKIDNPLPELTSIDSKASEEEIKRQTEERKKQVKAQAMNRVQEKKYINSISTKKENLEEQIKNYKRNNPFTATKNKDKYTKGAIKVNGDGKIISDGYKRQGGDSFYPVERVKSKGPPVVYETVVQAQTPLTIDEAAKYYKENVVDYGEVLPYKDSETIAYREGGGRMPKKPKRREIPKQKPFDSTAYGSPTKKPKVQPTADVSKLKELKEKRQKLERKVREIQEILNSGLFPTQASSKKSQLSRLKNQIKSLDKKITESAKTKTSLRVEESRALSLDVPNVNKIREILYPRSNREIDSIIILLDKFFQGESSEVENKISEEELTQIKELMEQTSSPVGKNDISKFISGLTNMVEFSEETIDGQKVPFAQIKLNREGATRATLKIGEKTQGFNFTVNAAQLNLPIEEKYSPEDFEKISQWMEEKYEVMPEVSDYQNFMNKLVGDIFNTVGIPSSKDMRSSTSDVGYDDITLPYMVEWLTDRNQPLLVKLKQNLSTIGGKKLTPALKSQTVKRLINGAEFKNKNFIPLMSKYLFDPAYKEILSTKQVNRMEKLLSEKIGNDTVIGLLLLVLDQTFSTKSQSQKDRLVDRLGVKPLTPVQPKGKIFDDKITPEMSDEEIAEIRSKRKEGATSKPKVESIKNRPKPADGPNKDWRNRRDLPRSKRSVSVPPFNNKDVFKADISSLPTKKRREVKALLQNAHPTEYFGEDYLRLGKVINIIDGLAEDEEAELLEKLGVKNLQMVKTAASLRKKYENLYEKLYNMVYDEEEE